MEENVSGCFFLTHTVYEGIKSNIDYVRCDWGVWDRYPGSDIVSSIHSLAITYTHTLNMHQNPIYNKKMYSQMAATACGPIG